MTLQIDWNGRPVVADVQYVIGEAGHEGEGWIIHVHSIGSTPGADRVWHRLDGAKQRELENELTSAYERAGGWMGGRCEP